MLWAAVVNLTLRSSKLMSAVGRIFTDVCMYCTYVFGRVVRVRPEEDHIAVSVLPHREAPPGWKRRCGLPRLAAKNIACTMLNDWDLEFAAPGKKQMTCRRRIVQRGNAALRDTRRL